MEMNSEVMDFDGEGRWVPILDYAVNKGVSLSTLRRYIKANKVVYRMENGRYLLWEDQDAKTPLTFAPKVNPMLARSGIGPLVSPLTSKDESANLEMQKLQRRIDDLQSQLNYAHEQINELKMLVAIYEEQLEGS